VLGLKVVMGEGRVHSGAFLFSLGRQVGSERVGRDRGKTGKGVYEGRGRGGEKESVVFASSRRGGAGMEWSILFFAGSRGTERGEGEGEGGT